MAITISKSPQALYPAYNDSWLAFTSSLIDNNKAEINIAGYPLFTLFPIDGEYIFNLKEIAKYEVNKSGFDDNLSMGDEWGYSMSNGYISLNINIKVYNGTTSEEINQNCTFFKSVKQIGEDIFDNNGQILWPSENGVDFQATYWEGFPFDFSLQRIGGVVTIKNLNSDMTSANIIPTVTGIMRIVVDKGSSNWTDTNYLPLFNTVNRLEVYDGGAFKSNLRLKKLNEPCGTYLKWFNPQGGYSYYLFDKFHNDAISTSSAGMVSQNQFLNIGSDQPSGFQKSLGKVGSRSIKLKTTADENELKHLDGLFMSPSVQMYTSHRAFEAGQWIDIEVTNSGFTNKTKKNMQTVDVDIELPELINAML